MHNIAIVNEKGGTGKTTTAVSLSAALGSLGQRVLLVDLDGQASTSRWFGVEEDDRLADALVAGEGLEPIENIAPGVSLAPASGKVDSVARDLRPSQSAQLRKVLRQVQDRYDLIIMDCPPSLNNRLVGNALLAATHVLVPVETSIMALDGLQILLTTLEDMSDAFEHQIVLAGVVACRYDIRTRLSRLVLDELRRALPSKVFNTVIRENVRMRECPASGQSILEFAPDSHAAEDYLALAKEMLDNPDAWQKPAHWETKDAGEIDDETQRCSVDNLRSRAAATVRAGAAKANQPKPLAPIETPDEAQLCPPAETPAEAQVCPAAETPAEAQVCPPVETPAEAQLCPPVETPAEAQVCPPVETPVEAQLCPPAEQAEAAEAGQADATHAAINRWTGGPLPNRAIETHEPPGGTPAASIAMALSPGLPPNQAALDSCIDRLAQAKARLSIVDVQVEADGLPTEPAPTEAAQGFEPSPTAAEQGSEPSPVAAAQGFGPEPVAPAQPAIEAARNVPPPAPEEPDEPEEPETGAKAFPALRAFLRQLGRADEEAEVVAAGGGAKNRP